jgi:hypothetical protein
LGARILYGCASVAILALCASAITILARAVHPTAKHNRVDRALIRLQERVFGRQLLVRQQGMLVSVAVGCSRMLAWSMVGIVLLVVFASVLGYGVASKP